MAFIDDLARDPKSEEEFWAIIEETFEQVEEALTDYPVETREEALEPQRSAPRPDRFRYRAHPSTTIAETISLSSVVIPT